MFDLGWTELLVVAVVAIVVVGPKDLPRALRSVGNYMGKARRMAGDFQRQFNEAVREADLDDVKKSVTDIGKIDPLGDIRKEMSKAEAGIKSDLEKVTKPGTPAKVEAKSEAAPETAKPATPAEPALAAGAAAAKATPKKASATKSAPKKPATSKAAPKKAASKTAPKKPVTKAAPKKPAAARPPAAKTKAATTEEPTVPAPAPASAPSGAPTNGAGTTTGDAKP